MEHRLKSNPKTECLYNIHKIGILEQPSLLEVLIFCHMTLMAFHSWCLYPASSSQRKPPHKPPQLSTKCCHYIVLEVIKLRNIPPKYEKKLAYSRVARRATVGRRSRARIEKTCARTHPVSSRKPNQLTHISKAVPPSTWCCLCSSRCVRESNTTQNQPKGEVGWKDSSTVAGWFVVRATCV